MDLEYFSAYRTEYYKGRETALRLDGMRSMVPAG